MRVSEQEGFTAAESQRQGLAPARSDVAEELWEGTEAQIP